MSSAQRSHTPLCCAAGARLKQQPHNNSIFSDGVQALTLQSPPAADTDMPTLAIVIPLVRNERFYVLDLKPKSFKNTKCWGAAEIIIHDYDNDGVDMRTGF